MLDLELVLNIISLVKEFINFLKKEKSSSPRDIHNGVGPSALTPLGVMSVSPVRDKSMIDLVPNKTIEF